MALVGLLLPWNARPLFIYSGFELQCREQETRLDRAEGNLYVHASWPGRAEGALYIQPTCLEVHRIRRTVKCSRNSY